MRLGDLGAQYVWERASFSTLRIGMIGYQSSHGSPSPDYTSGLVLCTWQRSEQIGVVRTRPNVVVSGKSWRYLIFRSEKVGKTGRLFLSVVKMQN